MPFNLLKDKGDSRHLFVFVLFVPIEYLEPVEILSKEEIRDFFQFQLDKGK